MPQAAPNQDQKNLSELMQEKMLELRTERSRSLSSHSLPISNESSSDFSGDNWAEDACQLPKKEGPKALTSSAPEHPGHLTNDSAADTTRLNGAVRNTPNDNLMAPLASMKAQHSKQINYQPDQQQLKIQFELFSEEKFDEQLADEFKRSCQFIHRQTSVYLEYLQKLEAIIDNLPNHSEQLARLRNELQSSYRQKLFTLMNYQNMLSLLSYFHENKVCWDIHALIYAESENIYHINEDINNLGQDLFPHYQQFSTVDFQKNQFEMISTAELPAKPSEFKAIRTSNDVDFKNRINSQYDQLVEKISLKLNVNQQKNDSELQLADIISSAEPTQNQLTAESDKLAAQYVKNRLSTTISKQYCYRLQNAAGKQQIEEIAFNQCLKKAAPACSHFYQSESVQIRNHLDTVEYSLTAYAMDEFLKKLEQRPKTIYTAWGSDLTYYKADFSGYNLYLAEFYSNHYLNCLAINSCTSANGTQHSVFSFVMADNECMQDFQKQDPKYVMFYKNMFKKLIEHFTNIKSLTLSIEQKKLLQKIITGLNHYPQQVSSIAGQLEFFKLNLDAKELELLKPLLTQYTSTMKEKIKKKSIQSYELTIQLNEKKLKDSNQLSSKLQLDEKKLNTEINKAMKKISLDGCNTTSVDTDKKAQANSETPSDSSATAESSNDFNESDINSAGSAPQSAKSANKTKQNSEIKKTKLLSSLKNLKNKLKQLKQQKSTNEKLKNGLENSIVNYKKILQQKVSSQKSTIFKNATINRDTEHATPQPQNLWKQSFKRFSQNPFKCQ